MTESFNRKLGRLAQNVSGTGTITSNAATASAWQTARTITLGGDLSGSVSIDGSSNVSLTATVSGDAVVLGTDTSGNYVATIAAGSGISVSGSGSETAAVTISIDNTVATLSGSQTLTNKTISGSNNTISNIGNGSLTNSSITVNGTSIALGASGTLVTDDIAEDGTPVNLWFTNTRARTAVSATDAGGDGSFSYDSGTGVFTYTGPSATEVRAHLSAGTGLTYTTGQFAIDSTVATLTGSQTLTNKTISGADNTLSNIGNSSLTNSSITINGGSVSLGGTRTLVTDDIAEDGSPSNLWYTDTRSRAAISVTDAGGDGSLSYNSGSGVITYTGPSAAEVRAHFSAGTGVAISSGQISIGQAVATTDNVTFAGVTADNIRVGVTGANEIDTSSGNLTIDSTGGTTVLDDDVNVTGNLLVDGNLTVSGTTVTVNTTNLAVEDNMIYLNNGSAVTNPDLGFAGNYNDGTYRHAGVFRDASDGVWKFFHQYTPEPDASAYIDITHGSFALAPVQASSFTGSLTGNVTGNASTATAWATGRTLTLSGDVTGTSAAFDGSGNISITTTIAANSVALGTDTTGDYVAAVAVAGTGLSVAGSGENATYTITSNATSANTGSTIVARDASGNFTAGTITAALSGNATTATNISGYSGTYWTSDNDGAGSGLDADLVDGLQASSFMRSAGTENNGTIIIRDNRSTTNYYNTVALEIRSSDQKAVIGLHRDGYSHVGIAHEVSNQLRFNFNSGDVYINSSAGTLWGSGNDGASSGLDADLLDGQQGAYYAAASSLSSYLPLSGGMITGNLGVQTGYFQLVTGSILASNASTRGFIMDGNYTNGQFRHRWRKYDDGNGIPLYLDYAHATADSYTAIARFGGGGTYRELDVYGTFSATTVLQGTNQVLHAGNYSSYALPLSGGSLTGDVQFGANYLRFDQSGTRSWNMRATGGNLDLASGDGSGSFRYNGNAVLTAGNYTNYTFDSVRGDSGAYNLNTSGQHAWTRFSTGLWVNGPTSGNYSHVLSFNGATDNRTVQVYLGDVPGYLWWRPNQGGTWHPWERILTSSNYNSWAPTLTGGGASGTWSINVTGSAGSSTSASYARYIPTYYIGDRQLNPQTYFNNGVGLNVAMTGAVGYWTDTLWINGYAGGDVLSMCALHTSRNGAPTMWISTQQSTATSYGTFYEFLTAYNYTNYSPSLTGGGASGTWGINITGNAATATNSSQLGGVTASNYFRTDGTYPNTDMNSVVEGFWHIASGSANTPINQYGHRWDYDHVQNGQWVVQMYSPTGNDASIWHRQIRNFVPQTWRNILDSSNYSSYALPLSGGTLTGRLTSSTQTWNGAITWGPGVDILINGESSNDVYSGGTWGVWDMAGPNYFISCAYGSQVQIGASGSRGLKVFGTMDAPSGYVSNGNPWGTANSAWFGNGITTAGSTNWIYGHCYLGNAPSNGSGAQVESNGKYYSSVSSGIAMYVRSTRVGGSGEAHNSTTLLCEQTRGDHSWGIVGEFRVGADAGTDRPSILFSTAYNTDTWTVGFGYAGDSNFRINRDHGWRQSSWGTTLMVMDRSGNVTFTGNVTAYSDRRLKTDIEKIDNALHLVKMLEGVTFKYKEDGRDGVGLIAQDVEKILPAVVGEATTSTGDTYKNVAYGNIVAVLIEAIKEQQSEIDELKNRLNKLQ